MKGKVIGRIEKPSVEHFKTPARKLYLIPLLYSGKELDRESLTEYTGKFESYWDDVKGRINDLEVKLGRINRIYHELIDIGGEKGLQFIKKLNKRSYQIIERFLKKGAKLEATEDQDLVRENMDWGRCLAAKPETPKVLMKISEFYLQTIQKRDEYIAKRIDETLKSNEIGILFIRENNSIKFPSDIEIFRIHPPVLDDIRQYLHNFYSKK